MEYIYKENGLFIYENGVEIGKAICRYSEDTVNILHVIVNPSMRGRGIAAELVKRVISDAREKGMSVIPTCSYAAAWVRNNKE